MGTDIHMLVEGFVQDRWICSKAWSAYDIWFYEGRLVPPEYKDTILRPDWILHNESDWTLTDFLIANKSKDPIPDDITKDVTDFIKTQEGKQVHHVVLSDILNHEGWSEPTTYAPYIPIRDYERMQETGVLSEDVELEIHGHRRKTTTVVTHPSERYSDDVYLIDFVDAPLRQLHRHFYKTLHELAGFYGAKNVRLFFFL